MRFSKIKLVFVFALVGLIYISCSKNKTSDLLPVIAAVNSNLIHFVFTSDPHYGLTKATFQGANNVDASIVNAALVNKLNALNAVTLPNDGGVNAGQTIDFVDCIITGGDIANREETSSNIQAATISWNQFSKDYIANLKLTNRNKQKTDLFIVPGNHDVSNTVGYYASMAPPTDASSMIGMYNLMINPSIPKTAASFNYVTDKVHYSKDIQGIHFMFINLWPDSSERVWMVKDLQNVSSTTPVFLFMHSIPNVEARFFTNPNNSQNINSTDKFENLLSEVFKDGAKTINDVAYIEQRAFTDFLKLRPNIKAFFHGHNNYNQYYVWQGPDNNISLNCFRVDSPMKGSVSATDETKLSFQFVAVDTTAKNMTIRECLWNPIPSNPAAQVTWGTSATISLK
ncbi:MAG: metallophosphoesterase [Bacteroidetes bacterium]|nr:metallophosphoesterase [Bacteroidota bacterium]